MDIVKGVGTAKLQRIRSASTLYYVGLVVAFVVYPHFASAQIEKTARSILNQPSLITQQAAFGLYTSIAVAGDRLVAVGQGGRIMLSDDDGKSWKQIQTPTSVTLTEVCFGSSNEGWAVGQMGVVLHSIDRGEHWTIQFDGFRANASLLSTAKTDVSEHPKEASAAADLQNAQQFLAGGPSVPFLTLLPISSEAVVAAGGFGIAFSSSDGGANWQSLFDQVPNPNGLNIYAIIKDGDGQLWVGEEGLVLLRDKNGNFNTLTTPVQGTFFGAIETKSGALVLYGLQGAILRSIDNGSHWNVVSTTSTGTIDCGIILSNGDLVLGSEDGNVLVSQDDGSSFFSVSADGPVVGIAQAADGTIITAGPQGMSRLSLTRLAQKK